MICAISLPAVLLSAAVSAAPAPAGPPELAVDPLPLRALLVARDFDGLEARVAAARAAPDTHELTLVFEAFANLAADGEMALDAWRAEHPQSAAARLAVASRELERAWEARGTGFANTVDAEERAQMRVHALRAVELAAAAVEDDAGWLDAYRIQIASSQLLGDAALAERVFATARSVDPTNYGVWAAYLNLFRRRWGGSYEAQEQLARAAQEHAAANPRLRLLLGAADHDRGNDLMNQRRYAEALAAYDRALLHGDDAQRLLRRSQVLCVMGDRREARATLDRALTIDPYLVKGHSHLAHICKKERDFACLAEATARAAELDPTEESYRRWHTWAAWAMEHPQAAARSLDRNPVQEWLHRHGYHLFRHALASAVLATLAGFGYYGMRARRRRRRQADAAASPITPLPPAPAPSGSPAAAGWSMVERLPRSGVLMVRAYVWLRVVVDVLDYSELTSGAGDQARLALDIAITLPALAGALGFAYGVRLGAAWLWKVWAVLFPLWNTFHQLQGLGFHWEHWPLWASFHVPLLPLYAALVAYGYGCPALWAGGSPGPGWRPSPSAPPTRPASSAQSGLRPR
jgi:tetratricopeptide (TPR) repeat protein